MASIVPAAELTREELRRLGENVIHAVDLERQGIAAVDPSLAAHGESVDRFVEPSSRPCPQRARRIAASLTPRPAA